MKIAKNVVLAASALALAVGSAWAADKPFDEQNKDGKLSKTEAANASRSDDSGYAKLDKNKDGYISKAEAKAEPELAKNFDRWDKNKDGKINRGEYLAAMAKEDVVKTKDKISEKLNKDSSSGSSSTK